ncbi:hypothetical protein [Chroococcidiopsis sp.]|uniref:hypothetical protein n=1 Tax=Chroococcidiopsis sp. TaxID=3088168 RepID=UPI003F375D9E
MIRSNPGMTALQAVMPKVNSGITGASTASPKYDYGHQRLQYVLNNRTETQTDNAPPQIESSTSAGSIDTSDRDNSFQAGARIGNDGNIYISRDLLGYQTPMSAEEQLKLVQKYENKKMERDAAISGIASLSKAFGKTGGFSTVFGSYTPSN